MSANRFSTAAVMGTGTFENGVADEVTQALRDSGYSELRNIEVDVHGHEVCLRGRVSSYFLRQKAEFVAFSIPDVGSLRSEIAVSSARAVVVVHESVVKAKHSGATGYASALPDSR